MFEKYWAAVEWHSKSGPLGRTGEQDQWQEDQLGCLMWREWVHLD